MLDEIACFQLIANDDQRHERNALSFAREQPQHRHFGDCGENDGSDPCQFEHPVKGDTDIAIPFLLTDA